MYMGPLFWPTWPQVIRKGAACRADFREWLAKQPLTHPIQVHFTKIISCVCAAALYAIIRHSVYFASARASEQPQPAEKNRFGRS
jgi:hypothetical protein